MALLTSVTDANRCFLGTEEQIVVPSVLRSFPDDIVALLEHPGMPLRQVEIPIRADILDDGRLVAQR